MHMKAVQVMMDEHLLQRLDADDEVRRIGRSAVLRRAAAEYLQRRRAQQVSDAYARAYARGQGLDEDLAGWEHEGAWPEA
jgi:metal-responsive CopG/Arc/MetJ family transcriptional regulator